MQPSPVHRLVPHPASVPPDIQITVSMQADGSTLGLRYCLAGDIGTVRLPPPRSPERGRRLWEHTCFEAFVRPAGGEAYFEFNVAPSRQWAMYHFTGYRTGMREVRELAVPRIGEPTRGEAWEISPALHPPLDRPARLGIAAVIEAADGTKSYWALAHPPGAPDFHHPDCFVAELPPPEHA